MKNLKNLLLPLFFCLYICNSVYSQKQENSKDKRIYIKEHIKEQIKDYAPNFCPNNKDTVWKVDFNLKSKPNEMFKIISSKNVSKEKVLCLIREYDDVLTYEPEVGIKFNRYYTCKKNSKHKSGGLIIKREGQVPYEAKRKSKPKIKWWCVNADEIKVYKVKGYK